MLPDLSDLPLFIGIVVAAAALVALAMGFGIGWLVFG